MKSAVTKLNTSANEMATLKDKARAFIESIRNEDSTEETTSRDPILSSNELTPSEKLLQHLEGLDLSREESLEMLAAIQEAAESVNDFDMTDLDSFKDLVRSSIIFTNKDDMDGFVQIKLQRNPSNKR